MLIFHCITIKGENKAGQNKTYNGNLCKSGQNLTGQNKTIAV